jgi:hypothetical protein
MNVYSTLLRIAWCLCYMIVITKDKTRLYCQIPEGRSLQDSIPVVDEWLSPEARFQQTIILYRSYRRTFQSPVPARSKNRGRFNQKAKPSIRLWDHMRNAFMRQYPPKSAITVFWCVVGFWPKAPRDWKRLLGTFGRQKYRALPAIEGGMVIEEGLHWNPKIISMF